jgi:hypothetical protein
MNAPTLEEIAEFPEGPFKKVLYRASPARILLEAIVGDGQVILIRFATRSLENGFQFEDIAGSDKVRASIQVTIDPELLEADLKQLCDIMEDWHSLFPSLHRELSEVRREFDSEAADFPLKDEIFGISVPTDPSSGIWEFDAETLEDADPQCVVEFSPDGTIHSRTYHL